MDVVIDKQENSDIEVTEDDIEQLLEEPQEDEDDLNSQLDKRNLRDRLFNNDFTKVEIVGAGVYEVEVERQGDEFQLSGMSFLEDFVFDKLFNHPKMKELYDVQKTQNGTRVVTLSNNSNSHQSPFSPNGRKVQKAYIPTITVRKDGVEDTIPVSSITSKENAIRTVKQIKHFTEERDYDAMIKDDTLLLKDFFFSSLKQYQPVRATATAFLLLFFAPIILSLGLQITAFLMQLLSVFIFLFTITQILLSDSNRVSVINPDHFDYNITEHTEINSNRKEEYRSVEIEKLEDNSIIIKDTENNITWKIDSKMGVPEVDIRDYAFSSNEIHTVETAKIIQNDQLVNGLVSECGNWVIPKD